MYTSKSICIFQYQARHLQLMIKETEFVNATQLCKDIFMEFYAIENLETQLEAQQYLLRNYSR